MALTTKEKLTLQRETAGLKKRLKTEEMPAREKLTIQRQVLSNIKTLKGEAGKAKSAGAGEAGIIERYVSGEFNSLALTDFFRKVDEVEAAGASLDQILEGGAAWVEANPDKVAA